MKTALNILLFLAAPFIGLLYALLMPIVGLGMLLFLSLKSDNDPKNYNSIEVM